MNQLNLESIISSTEEIILAHRKESIEKGEDFNIFSVLGMESNETKTHSAMLIALLNPKGNHYQGTRFLKLFLEEIEYDYKDKKLEEVQVKAEYYLGKISEACMRGGFIDILITFSEGETIAIENKIYAGDQCRQMYRYSLYNMGKSHLYYLNLFGDKPSDISLHNLKEDDYKVITYNEEILRWLEKCLLVVKPGSIIETSIKQYEILLKKLTHTMSNDLEKSLDSIIINNLEEAKYIHAHYQKVVDNIRSKFREAIFYELKKSGLSLDITLGKDVSNIYSQIWLENKDNHKKDFCFGIESFSGKGHDNGNMFIGVYDANNTYSTVETGDRLLNAYWPVIRDLKCTDNTVLSLSKDTILKELNTDSSYFDTMVHTVVKQVQDFVSSYHNHCLKQHSSSNN